MRFARSDRACAEHAAHTASTALAGSQQRGTLCLHTATIRQAILLASQ
jgi:hypothetical protein